MSKQYLIALALIGLISPLASGQAYTQPIRPVDFMMGMHVPATPTGVTRKYHLYATDGYITMQDGTKKYSYGFNDTGQKGVAIFPSPLIWANVGDRVEITLTNLGMKYRPDITDPHTIHLHGVHVTPYYDGFPETSFAVPMGSSFTYIFIANREGSYMYHCHQEAVEHVQMDMYGPLIMYANNAKTIYGVPYSKEYVWLLSEIDSRWHASLAPRFNAPAISQYDQTDPAIPYGNWVRVNFRPDYWLINGLGFPDTIRTSAELPIRTLGPTGQLAGIQNGIYTANKQPNHPGLQQGSMLEGGPDEALLIRFIQMGFQTHVMHAHCSHYEILGSDATPLPSVQQGLATNWATYYPYEKFTLLIGSGETYDVIYMLHKALIEQSQALVPQPEHSPFGPAYTGAFYEPTANGFFYWPAHCHDDYHVADQGVYPTGMLTLIKSPRSAYKGGVPTAGLRVK